MGGKVVIYALVDDAGAVHYVGQTRNVKACRHYYRWRRPALTMTPLVEVKPEEANAAERACIERYRAAGYELANVKDRRPYVRKTPKGEDTVPFMVRLPVSLGAQVKELAAEETTAVAVMLRQLVRDGLRHRKEARRR